MKACPKCGFVGDFDITTPVVFGFDGVAITSRILKCDPEENAGSADWPKSAVICNQCDWLGTVADLVEPGAIRDAYTDLMGKSQAEALLHRMGIVAKDLDRLSHRLLYTGMLDGTLVGVLIPAEHDDVVRLVLSAEVLDRRLGPLVHKLRTDYHTAHVPHVSAHGFHRFLWTELLQDGKFGPIGLAQYMDHLTED